MSEENNTPKHLVVTVHGIRTLRRWGNRFEDLYTEKFPDTEFHHFDFGFYDFVSFVIPTTRSVIIRRLVDMLKGIRSSPNDRVDIIAHSFGTYVVAKALQKVRPDQFNAHTVIFCGSVLPRDFRWEQLIETGVVKRIVNDCALNDVALVATQFFVLGTGVGGLLGFYGMNTDRFENRYFAHGHSGFFSDEDGDNKLPTKGIRMLERWGPLIGGDKADGIESYDERDREPSVGKRVWWTFLNNFAPLKLAAYIAPLVALYLFVGSLQLQTETSKAKGKALEAQNLTESGSMLALVDQITGDGSSKHIAKKLMIVQILGQLVSKNSQPAWDSARENWIHFEKDLKMDPEPYTKDEPGGKYWFLSTFFKGSWGEKSNQILIDELTEGWAASQQNRNNLMEITCYLKPYITIQISEIKKRWYEQALMTVNEIATAAKDKKEIGDISGYWYLFWRLNLGELLLVESYSVEMKMAAIGEVLEQWEETGGVASDEVSKRLRAANESLNEAIKSELSLPSDQLKDQNRKCRRDSDSGGSGRLG